MPPTMQEIIAADVIYAGDTEIEVNTLMPSVLIGGPDGVFLDGHEAENFLAEAKKLYEELGDVTLDDIYKHLAKNWIDSLYN